VALSGMARDDSRGEGWLQVVDPLDRQSLRIWLRRAAETGGAGGTSCRMADPEGRRWSRWWWCPGPDSTLAVWVAGTGGNQVQISGQRRDDGHDPPEADAEAGIELASMIIRRISSVGMTLASAACLIDGPAAARIQRALSELDDLIADVRTTAFDMISAPHLADGR
jgi:hypothetical protein